MIKKFAPAKFRFFFTVLVLMLAASYGFGQTPEPFSINNSPLPAPTGFVNDYAGVIDAATKQQLETRLKEFKKKTNPSVEIAVAVVKTTGDRAIFDYSLAVARGWKIGSKEDDNPSALLFVAIDDRKYFTQVSKDLEGILPDGAVGSLQRQYLVPEFKKGNYGKGISDTIEAYIRTIQAAQSGEVPPGGKTVQPKKQSGGIPSLFNNICCLVIIGIIILTILGIFTKKGKGGGGSGGGGGVLPWLIGGIIGSSLSGGSGDSGGSSSGWGGGGSSGGFGGFGGGGDFGGGGAGGSW